MLKQLKRWFGFPTVADYQSQIIEQLERITEIDMSEKKTVAKKSPAKKSPAKKSPAKKSPAKKSPAKKTK